MNLNDIHIGDIAVTKEGVKYKIVNFYYTYRVSGEIRLDLCPVELDSFIETTKNDSETIFSYNDYAWVGQIDNLNKTFDKIGENVLNSSKEKVMEKFKKVTNKIDNIYKELFACGVELREFRKMVIELLDKQE